MVSELVPQTSFRWEPSGGVEKCRYFFKPSKPELLFSYFFVETNLSGCQLNTVFIAKKLVQLITVLGRTRKLIPPP